MIPRASGMVSTGKILCLTEQHGERLLLGPRTSDVSEYCQTALCMIRPQALRSVMTNFDPTIFWKFGFQMVSCPHQTVPGMGLLYHLGFFAENAHCGYKLRPPRMRSKSPQQTDTRIDQLRELEIQASDAEDLQLSSFQVLCARQLPNAPLAKRVGSSTDLMTVSVSVSLKGGTSLNNNRSFPTRTVVTSGLDPSWASHRAR